MSQNLVNKADQPIRCISCGKVIGQGFIVEGSIQLQCKCGVKTKIEAEKKPAGQVTIKSDGDGSYRFSFRRTAS